MNMAAMGISEGKKKKKKKKGDTYHRTLSR